MLSLIQYGLSLLFSDKYAYIVVPQSNDNCKTPLSVIYNPFSDHMHLQMEELIEHGPGCHTFKGTPHTIGQPPTAIGLVSNNTTTSNTTTSNKPFQIKRLLSHNPFGERTASNYPRRRNGLFYDPLVLPINHNTIVNNNNIVNSNTTSKVLLLEVQSVTHFLSKLDHLPSNYLFVILFIKNDYYSVIQRIRDKCNNRRVILGIKDRALYDRIIEQYCTESEKGNGNGKGHENVKGKGKVVEIICYAHIERVFLLIFYVLLLLLIIITFMTVQIWLKTQRTKNPLITPYELSVCRVMEYGKMLRSIRRAKGDETDETDETDEKDNNRVTGLTQSSDNNNGNNSGNNNNSGNEEDTCLICMDTFSPDSVVRILICNHYYHKECVDPWLKERCSRCPLCRQLIKMGG